MIPAFAYVRPKLLKTAVRHLAAEGAVVHAGGTDLLGCLRERLFDVRKIVSLGGVSRLRGITRMPNGGLRIGALTTIAEIAQSPLVGENYTALAQGAAAVGSPQLRNQGTIGGNLCQKPRCWYYRGEFDCLRKGGGVCFAATGENQFHCLFGGGGICYIVHPSDTSPPLVALSARVEIVGPEDTRHLAVEDLHVLPADDVRRETWLESGEILTAVVLPPPSPGLISSYRKVRARRSWDFALASVAMALVMDGDRVVDGRIAFGGVAPVPWRADPVEAAIKGKRISQAVLATAADAAVRDAAPMEKNAYKIPLLRGLVQECLAGVEGARQRASTG
jgi:xanthine dehydrogenase YagS FAD-binding subunit